MTLFKEGKEDVMFQAVSDYTRPNSRAKALFEPAELY